MSTKITKLRKKVAWLWADAIWYCQQRFGWFVPATTSQVGGSWAGMAPHIRPSRRKKYLAAICERASTAQTGSEDASGPYICLGHPQDD